MSSSCFSSTGFDNQLRIISGRNLNLNLYIYSLHPACERDTLILFELEHLSSMLLVEATNIISIFMHKPTATDVTISTNGSYRERLFSLL